MDDFSKTTKGDWITLVVILLVFMGLMAAAAYHGAKAAGAVLEYVVVKNEIVQCEKLSDYELVFPEWDPETRTGFFITGWQKEMCDGVGIELDAHVVDYQKN